jgi:hypothetical protein
MRTKGRVLKANLNPVSELPMALGRIGRLALGGEHAAEIQQKTRLALVPALNEHRSSCGVSSLKPGSAC